MNQFILTEMKTSSACCRIATLDQPNFCMSFTLVGLCTVAEGWVRKKVGNLLRSDKAGELEPNDTFKKTDQDK